MASSQECQINKQILKTKSGEFDIESIHSLVLHDLGISSLGCIGECSALERLDLSRNDISKLYPLASLTNLTYLNLSRNRITSLEGLQSLDNLKMLNLAGNLLGSMDGLYVLKNLENLEDLRLQDTVHELSNPLCMSLGYKKGVLDILPDLKVLDGERLSGKGSQLFTMCAEIDKMLEEKAQMSARGDENLGHKGDWMPADFLEHKKSAEFDAGLMGDAQQQLEDMLADCKRVSARTSEAIQKALAEAKKET